MENMDDFCYEGKPSRATAKSILFAVSKDEWDTKENTGKSMKNALYTGPPTGGIGNSVGHLPPGPILKGLQEAPRRAP